MVGIDDKPLIGGGERPLKRVAKSIFFPRILFQAIKRWGRRCRDLNLDDLKRDILKRPAKKAELRRKSSPSGEMMSCGLRSNCRRRMTMAGSTKMAANTSISGLNLCFSHKSVQNQCRWPPEKTHTEGAPCTRPVQSCCFG